MKRILITLALLSISAPAASRAQEAVPAGAGSYAAYPPLYETVLTDGVDVPVFYNFATTTNIMVRDGETRPLPSNDWWTSWLYSESDLLGGKIWAYPFTIDPANDGIQLYRPTRWNDSGTDMLTENLFRISGEDFSPTRSIVEDWSDWTVTAGFQDGARSLRLTAAHGMPFVWLETENLTPQLRFDSVAFFDAAGQPASFPLTATALAFRAGDAVYGIHAPEGTGFDYSGTEMMTIDLGATRSIDEIVLHWEAAYGSAYSIAFSGDNVTYTSVADVTDGDGDVDTLPVSGSARYVRITFVEKATQWPYSLWEVEIMHGTDNLAKGRPVTVTSESGYVAANAVDGNLGTRWQAAASDGLILTINLPAPDSYFVVSSMTSIDDLSAFDHFARNRPLETTVSWNYDVEGGRLSTSWDITTTNLETAAIGFGDVLQGFIPHHYRDGIAGFDFIDRTYSTPRGMLKLAGGNQFTFDYPFNGILPHISHPVRNTQDATPYDDAIMYRLVTEYVDSIENNTPPYGSDTYWGGKDLVRIGRYMMIARELDHPDYAVLRDILKDALADWMTFTPGEQERYFAWYPEWKALIGFNESYYSGLFTDNHFHYGYFIQAAALLATCEPDFVQAYEPMLTLVAKQYANWDHADTRLPFLRTMDPWIGHSYAGGLSSGNGNNQESTSEALQSWAGLYLLGCTLGNDAMRDAGAFGYASEARATQEYWFDLHGDVFPDEYEHPIVGILWNGGNAYATYFGAEPFYIHGIQMLPYGTYMNYMAMGWDRTRGINHYDALLQESYDYLVNNSLPAAQNQVSGIQAELDALNAIADPTDEDLAAIAELETRLFYAELGLTGKQQQAADGKLTEAEIGRDWGHVILTWLQLFDPARVTALMDEYWDSDDAAEYDFMHSPYTSGFTYYFTHATQTYGRPRFDIHMSIPTGQAFRRDDTGETTFIVYNPKATDELCIVYQDETVLARFIVPARSTYNSRYPDGIPGGMLSNGWYHGDIGTVSEVGSAGLRGAALTITAAGSGSETNDALHFVYRTATGDLTALVRIADMSSSADARTGLMLRNSLASDAGSIFAGRTGDGRLVLKCRSADGDASSLISSTAGFDTPLWLKLERSGNLFTAYSSPDGETWAEFGSTEATLNEELYGGIAASGSDGISATVSSYAMARFSAALDGRVEAENYSASFGVQTENTGDVDGGENVGWIDAGDWMSYTLNVATGGYYTVAFRVASPSGSELGFETGNGYSDSLAIPSTGGYQGWTTIELENVPVQPGIQTFTVRAEAGGWNFNWFSLTRTAALPAESNPRIPTDVSASDATTPDRIDIAWGPVDGLYEYDVWRGTSSNAASAVLIAENCYSAYSDTDVAAGAVYYYWISEHGISDPGLFSNPDRGSTQGTPTAWQEMNYPGGYPGDEADTDLDGFTSMQEYIASTNPNDTGSFFRISEVERVTASELVMRWDAANDRRYQVEWTASLTNEFIPLPDDLPYPTASYTNRIIPSDLAGFFRVVVELAP
ncbi:MAG: carbohydrate-binding protein [Pontiellaceae bacterium]|nr:carbohydrate-binding protein [Pontiellaceae bacterium]MBN2784875.1 carbohydrate-binding protein [Pontiellaceae bacterium]